MLLGVGQLRDLLAEVKLLPELCELVVISSRSGLRWALLERLRRVSSSLFLVFQVGVQVHVISAVLATVQDVVACLLSHQGLVAPSIGASLGGSLLLTNHV